MEPVSTCTLFGATGRHGAGADSDERAEAVHVQRVLATEKQWQRPHSEGQVHGSVGGLLEG